MLEDILYREDEEVELEKILFVPAFVQLELARQRNKERGWGFNKKDFDSLGDPPSWPDRDLGAVILSVQLDTVQETFEEAWYCAASVQPNAWRCHSVKPDRDHLRLLPGTKHERGLAWVEVDLAANWNKGNDGIIPASIRSPKTSPHVAVLWAASYFPKWIQAMNGKDVPEVWVPGYQLNLPDAKPWSHVLYLDWGRQYRFVRLYAFDAQKHSFLAAVPAIL